MSLSSKIYSSRDEIETDKLRCWLEINLSYLKNNIESIKSIISDDLDIIAVVKANGYGLGALNIAKYLASIGIKYFAVATLEEALELRIRGNIKEDIIILSWTAPSEKETLIKYDLTQSLIDFEYAKKLNDLPGVVKCHIKIDTGMNRFGQTVNDIENIREIYTYKNLKVLGIYSHLCRVREFGEEPDNYTKMQIENFNIIIEQLEKEGINVGLKHIMNSFGILRFNDKKYDLVRPGLLMYGVSPDPNNQEIDKLLDENNFKPVASLKCKVMTIKTIEEGEKVGYNSKFIAQEKTKIATISIGYADGLSFASSRNEFRVIIKGYLCPVIGNVCMDNTIVKIPLESDIQEGDIATLFGYADDREEHLNHKEFLTKSGAPIGETFARLGQRITRICHL
jgi:serine/alanine racemase